MSTLYVLLSRCLRSRIVTGGVLGFVLICNAPDCLVGCALADPDPLAGTDSTQPLSPDPSSDPASSSAAMMEPEGTAVEPPPAPPPPLPVVSEEDAKAEALRLQEEMRQKVRRFSTYASAQQSTFVRMAKQAIDAAGVAIDRPQLVMVIDRAANVQRADFVLALPNAPWVSVGGAPVSTGTTARKYYYITPTGVFHNTTDRLGYRAEGTKNKYGIRGIGAKGSRVWDLGWQTAVKGWLPRHETGQIRLEIHATDPQFLEWRLGHPASEGCIRIPAGLNQVMDQQGLIDVLYEQASRYDRRFAALLPKERKPTLIAGDLVVVIDSGVGTEPKIDPQADKRPLP